METRFHNMWNCQHILYIIFVDTDTWLWFFDIAQQFPAFTY